MRTLASCILLALIAVLAHAQSEDVKRDIQEVDDRATKPFEQREREAVMRRLGRSNDPAAMAKLVSLLNDEIVHIRAAAERILREAGDAADKPLIEALTHKQPEVRRRAARVLGGRATVQGAAKLIAQMRQDKDESARVQAAHALGAIARKHAAEKVAIVAALAKAAKGNDATAGAAARELGRLKSSEHASAIAALLRAKSWEAAVGACDGLAALGQAEPHTDALAKAAVHADWRVRIAAVQAMCAAANPDEQLYRKVLAERLADKDWRVQRRTIEALVDLWQPPAADLLVHRLADEESALALDIVHALEDLTGTKQGYAREAWKNWWQGIGRKQPLAERKPRPKYGWLRAPRAGAVESGGSGATVTYFDIPVFARPAVFVFDMSGSMRDPSRRGGSKSRADLSKEELARTLAGMPAGSSINLVIYRYYSSFPPKTEVQRAFATVQPHSARTVEAANSWIAGQEARGWGAFYEGLLAAMEDPAAQALYFLSDGTPSAGEYVDRDELIEALAHARRFMPVVIHGVLVGGGGRDEEFMRGMAESCGGQFADAR